MIGNRKRWRWLLLPIAVLLSVVLASCGGAPTYTQQTASYTVKLTLDSLAVGDRTVTIDITDQAGQPVTAERVMLTPTMLSMGMASPQTEAQAVGDGRYTAEAVLVSMTGDWEFDVTIETEAGSETARFNLVVPTE